MVKKLIFSTLVCLMLAMTGSVLAVGTYSEGIVVKGDVQGAGDPVQAGWTEINAFWNVDVAGLGFSVKVESHVPSATEGRGPYDVPAGPKEDVEADLLFGDNTAAPPDNDMILTLRNLKAGVHRIFSYHRRADEGDVPMGGVAVSGDDLVSVLSSPGSFMQDHNIMTIPAETIFNAAGGGGDVIIRFVGPSESGGDSGQAYVNGFILEYFGASNKAPYNPSPAHDTENICPDAVSPVTWTPGTGVGSQSIYFGSEVNDVDPCAVPAPTPVDTGVVGGSWTTPALTGGVTYYWRVDSAGVEGAIWKFTTNAGVAFDPVPANGWRGLPTDADVSWSAGCDATSHDVYFGTAASPPFIQNQAGTSYDPGALSANTTYYWKIIEQPGGAVSPIWSFKTGSGLEQTLLHYDFDGILASPLPSTLLDETGNETFTRDIDDINTPAAALDYGLSTIWGTVSSGTSASFTPEAGLYRAGQAVGTDPLVLDGYQYTLECWVNPDTLTDPEGDNEARDAGVVLISMAGDGGPDDTIWGLELSQPAGAIFVHKGNETDRQNMQIYSGKGTVRTGEWSHIAAVWDLSDANTAKIYVNGQLFGAAAKPAANAEDTNNVPIGIGYIRSGSVDYAFEGRLDEVKIHNYALEVSEFGLVPGPEWASGPDPANGQRRVDPNADLSWSAGDSAVSHTVYLGTDFLAVKNATPASPEHQGNQLLGNETFDPGTMDFGTSYYWRIDEQGPGGPWTGMIWKFTVQSLVDDPNMMLWYPLNETSGNIAEDASGHDAPGSVDNSDNWDPNDGEEGCLIFDDDNSIAVPPEALQDIYTGISISVWLKDASRPTVNNWVYDTAGSDIDVQVAVPDETGLVYWRAGNDVEDVLTWNASLDAINLDTLEDWHHWAFTKSESSPEMSIYFDGEIVETNSVTAQTLDFVRGASSRIGAAGGNSADLVARVDDFMIFDYALTAGDVATLFRRGDVANAWKPDPRNAAVEVVSDSNLSWLPGDFAISHDVYFGTDFDDVNDATTSSAAFKGNQAGTSYEPGLLTLGNTYYWRIDEVNNSNINSPWKGTTWKFTVANYLVIDDMESYDPFINRIWHKWDNPWGTGSFVELGVDPFAPVHRGNNSMEYVYDNFTKWDFFSYWSEAEYNFDSSQDWTVANVKLLTIFFYGDPANAIGTTEQLSVGVAGTSTRVDVDIPDMNDLLVAEWQEWNIELSDFAAAPLTAVDTVYLKFGDSSNTDTPGGEGIVYFDDIRLYPPKCVPSEGPAYDFTGDCLVGPADLGVMADEWLKTDAQLAVSAPAASPVAHWELDEGTGTTASDSGPNLLHGTLEDTYEWVAGRIGTGAVDFSGGRVLVPDAPALKPTTAVTVTAWINSDGSQSAARIVVKGADNREAYELEAGSNDSLVFVTREDDPNNSGSLVRHEAQTDGRANGEWIHIAGSYDGSDMRVYINGMLMGTESVGSYTLSQDPNGLAIGNRSDVPTTNQAFYGAIDDVRVYNVALADAEVAHIATEGTGYVPLVSIANIHDTEAAGQKAVNFKDYALLMQSWLEEILWPL